MAKLTLTKLQEFVRSGAAARSRVTLQPAAGEGTKVFPPTYAGAVYATEKRRLPGCADPVDCVLLDSVQSQANRLEEALQQAIDCGRLKDAGVSLPLVEVDFTSFYPGTDKAEPLRLLEPVGKVTSLQAPHRIVDAILRDSVVVEDGKRFRAKAEKDESRYGQRLRRVTAQNATALFELCPTALLLGMWDSTGPKGGLGPKFERALVSEIVGINAVSGVRSSSRIDPVAIQLEAGPVYVAKDDQSSTWTLDPSKARLEGEVPLKVGKKKDGKPSEINHGNIKPDLKDKNGQQFHGGVTCDRAEQTIVLSFPALRRLRFPISKKKEGSNAEETILDPNVDDAARTVLAALGLCAAALAAEAGLDLRSRCLLWPTNPLSWELLGKPGVKEEGITIEADDAINLLKEAIAAAKDAGLPWHEQPLKLVPSPDLVKLVVKSQQLAQSQGGEGGD
jgi:CRISPR-associated protein Csb1